MMDKPDDNMRESFAMQVVRTWAGLEEKALKEIITIYAKPPIDCNKLSLDEILARMKEQNISIAEFRSYEPYRKCVMQNGEQIGPMFYVKQEWSSSSSRMAVIFEGE